MGKIGRIRLRVLVPIVFLASLTISAGAAQLTTGTLTETRKSALVNALSHMQHSDGSFQDSSTDIQRCLVSTAEAAIIIRTLGSNINSTIDAEKCKQYIVEQINLTRDLGVMQKIVLFSEYFDLKLNRSSVIQFVLSRYNESGAFYEQGGRCYFRIDGLDYRTAYSNPNIVSTFLAVDILSRLNALEEINVTKTIAWIVSCKTANGFKPFPEVIFPYPFSVDFYDIGVPYTYCGISALKTLGHLDDCINDVDRHNMSSYILICYDGFKHGFRIHRDAASYETELYYSLYAVETLHSLRVLEQTETMNIIRDVANHLVEEQKMRVHGWPIPATEGYYGLFCEFEDTITGSYEAVRILQLASMLHLLDSATPRAISTIVNLMVFSFLVTAIPVGVPYALKLAYNRYKEVKANPIGT